MRKYARVTFTLAVLLVLAVVLFPTAGCGGGGGGGDDDVTPNNWDAMLWDTGIWQ